MSPPRLLLALLLLLALPAVGEPLITLTGDSDYPPSSWFHEGRLYGVAARLVETALAERQRTVDRFAEVPWQRALMMIKHGEADIIASLYHTKAREATLIYVPTPYMDDTLVLWVRAGAEFPFRRLADLRGKRGVMIIGYSAGAAFDAYADQLDIERLSDIELSLRMLANGRADYLVYSWEVGRVLVAAQGYAGRLTRLQRPLAVEPLYLGISRRSELAGLVDFLDARVRRYRADGRIAAWIQSETARYQRQVGAIDR